MTHARRTNAAAQIVRPEPVPNVLARIERALIAAEVAAASGKQIGNPGHRERHTTT